MSNFIVSAEHAVKILNEAFELDPGLIKQWCNPHVTSTRMTDHPTIQVQSMKNNDGHEIKDMTGNPIYRLGLIGLLNGLFGIDENGQGPIARMVDRDTGELTGFCINTNLKPDARPVNTRHCQRCNKEVTDQSNAALNFIFCSPECSDKFQIGGK